MRRPPFGDPYALPISSPQYPEPAFATNQFVGRAVTPPARAPLPRPTSLEIDHDRPASMEEKKRDGYF